MDMRPVIEGDSVTHRYANDEGRAYLKANEMEEMRLYGLDIQIRHMRNRTSSHSLYVDRPQKERDYSAVSFETKAFIRYPETEQNLKKYGIDTDKMGGFVIFSSGLLEELGESIIISDLLDWGDGRLYEVLTVKSGDEFRRLHEPVTLRIICGVRQFRETSLTNKYPRT